MKKKLAGLIGLSIALGLVGCGTVSSTSVPAGSSTPADSSSSAQASSSATSSKPAESSTPSSSASDSTTKYTVTFDPANGKKKTTQEVAEGGLVSKPTSDPVYGGKKFLGWYNGDTAWNFDTDTVTENVTLTAKWALNTDYVLEDTESVDIVNEYSEFTVWDGSTELILHNKDGEDGGWGATGNTFSTGWETFLIFDADGKVCYGIWCPWNGYGAPAAYTYMHDVQYSKDNLTYEGNPAIVLGDNFAADSNDFKLVIPQGGFAITGHNPDGGGSGGTDIMARLVTGGEWEAYNDDTKAEGYTFSASHCEFTSCRKFVYNKDKGQIEVYCLATYLNFTGTRSGVGAGTDDGVYTVKTKITKNGYINLNYFNGITNKAITPEKVDFSGDYSTSATTDLKLYVTEDDPTKINAGANGIYTLVYDLNAKTLVISAEEIKKESETGVTFKGVLNEQDAVDGISAWPEGTKLHTEAAGWAAAGVSEWSSFLIIDANGKVAYFCVFPNNGFGGASDSSYMCAADYADVNTNPCFVRHDGYAAWTEEDQTSCQKFDLVVPQGGYGFALGVNPLVDMVNLLTGGEIPEFEDEWNCIVSTNTYRTVTNKVTFAYDAEKGILTGDIAQDKTVTLHANMVNEDGGEDYVAIWDAGTKLYTEEAGWSAATGSPWRAYGVVDADGKLCYFCHMPTNGYGGPKATSYIRHSDYDDWSKNPAITLKAGWAPWSTEDGVSCGKWELTVPQGGFGFTTYGVNTDKVVQILTDGEIEEAKDTTIAAINSNVWKACDKMTITRDGSNIVFTTKADTPAVNLQAKLGDGSTSLPAIYDHSTESVDRGENNYAIGVNADGRVIYAQWCGDGYSACNDPMYLDQDYGECEAGKSFSVFNVESTWLAWTMETPNNCMDFTVRAPEGGYIITGSLTKMNPFFQAIFDVDMSDYELNTFFTSVEYGSANDKVVTIAANAQDPSIYDIAVK